MTSAVAMPIPPQPPCLYPHNRMRNPSRGHLTMTRLWLAGSFQFGSSSTTRIVPTEKMSRVSIEWYPALWYGQEPYFHWFGFSTIEPTTPSKQMQAQLPVEARTPSRATSRFLLPYLRGHVQAYHLPPIGQASQARSCRKAALPLRAQRRAMGITACS